MSDIITVLQIASFVGGAVWIVASIKATVDNLRQSMTALAQSVDKLNDDIIKHGVTQKNHDERIRKLERMNRDNGQQ